MTKSVWLRSLLVAACLVPAARPALANGWYSLIDESAVRSAYLVPGELVELELDPAHSALRTVGGAPSRYAAGWLEFDKLEGESFSVVFRTPMKVYVTVYRADPEATGNRPGWKSLGSYRSAPNGGVVPASTAGFFGGRRGGRFRYEFQAEQPGDAGRVQAWLVSDDEVVRSAGPPKFLKDPTVERWRKLYFEEFPLKAQQPMPIAAARPERRWKRAMPPVHGAALSSEGAAWAQDKPEPLRPFYAALHADGEHNAVLNFEKLGLAAAELGEYGAAEWAFDEALSRIETVYTKDAAAIAARSKWAAEAIKDFKGEPYERTMAYYYRGLLYLRAGDYENVRAAFAAAEYQDTVSEAEEYQGDFAAMNWLAGWSARCAGSDALAAESFAAAARIDPALQPPADGHDWLYVAEFGSPPVKMRRGQTNEYLYFAWPEDFDPDAKLAARVRTGDPRAATLELVPAADLVWQATTRGSRPIDAVIRGKAAFMQRSALSADVLLQAAQAVPGLFLVGVAVAAVAGQTEPYADIRTWDTLPGRIALGAGGAPGDGATFEFDGESSGTGAPWVRARAGRCGLVWARARSAIAAGAGVPGNDAEVVADRARKKEAASRDAAFRAALQSAAPVVAPDVRAGVATGSP